MRHAAEVAWRGRAPIGPGIPVIVDCWFAWNRPKSLDKIEPEAFLLLAGRKGDGDNLQKAVYDAITGPIVTDDCQLAAGVWWRLYAPTGSPGFVRCRLRWSPGVEFIGVGAEVVFE